MVTVRPPDRVIQIRNDLPEIVASSNGRRRQTDPLFKSMVFIFWPSVHRPLEPMKGSMVETVHHIHRPFALVVPCCV